MNSLAYKNEFAKTLQNDKLSILLKDLRKNVITKKGELKIFNEKLERPVRYPEFDRPELIKPAGLEITNIVRKNFSRLIKEADKYSAIDGEFGKRIPSQQVQDLQKMIFTNRIFMSGETDHDRSRVEFDVKRDNIIEEWEKKYQTKWPVYKEHIFNEDMIMAKKGKKVSRHHFLPVRAILVPENSKISELVDEGKINLANPQLFKHHSPNEYQNMIPSLYPKDHLGGIHNSDSIFASIFGPIKKDYHYDQIEANDDSRFKNSVPKKYQAHDVPTFAREYGYYLAKLEERLGYKLPVVQKEKVVGFVNEYVKSLPSSNVLKELDYMEILKNIRTINNMAEKSLINNWEANTNMKWPQNVRLEFLIPPFFKPKEYVWWMITPGKKNQEHHDYRSNSHNNKRHKHGKNYPNRDNSGYKKVS